MAPQNVDGGAAQTVDEGDLVSLGGSFTDPGSADTHTFLWEGGRGNGQTITNGTGQNFSFTPNDNGSYAVTFTVTDDDAGASSDNFTVTVDNVAPTATFNAPLPVNEGSPISLSLTSRLDPSTWIRRRLHLRLRLRDGPATAASVAPTAPAARPPTTALAPSRARSRTRTAASPSTPPRSRSTTWRPERRGGL